MFLQHVHAGFTSGGRTAFGPMHPRHMQTVAEQAGEPDGITDWDEEQETASTRLLLVASNGGMADRVCEPRRVCRAPVRAMLRCPSPHCPQ